MAKTLFGTRQDLERLILKELRTEPKCRHAVSVTVRRLRSSASNWEISTFDPGASEPSACKAALARIYARHAAVFDLIGKA